MDSKKVTRRAVLGSIATGLAGTAVIVHAASNRKSITDDYENAWDRYVKTLDVPVKKIGGPQAFTLNFKPTVGSTFRTLVLNAFYDQRSGPAKYPERPSWFSTIEGTITGLSPLIDAKPALLIHVKDYVVHFRSREEHREGKDCIIVPNDADFGYYVLHDKTIEKLSMDKVGDACFVLARSLRLYIPATEHLTVGKKWVIPAAPSRLSKVELPCEVVGFADVAGRQTVKISAEKSLSVQESVLLQKSSRREKKAADEAETRTIRLTLYVDIKTGLAVRQEGTTIIHHLQETPWDQTSTMISQLIAS